MKPCWFYSPADIVLAVPHVHRPKADYLLATMESLLKNMNEQEKATTVIVVMVAEPWNEDEFERVVHELSPKSVSGANVIAFCMSCSPGIDIDIHRIS